ncbi:MAG: flavin reductase family protein [Lachnospiraceae bacterium]|nr:flavin reductase family protein [Lachnospiraceae bacterium]
MHQFQPYPVNLLELNPFTKISEEWMLIAAGNQEKTNAMTASWGGMGVLWGKNVAFIFVRENRYTKEFIEKETYFSCNFFDKKYKNDLKYFGVVSGRQEDKFKVSGLNINFKDDIPFVDEGNFICLCRKMAAVPINEAHFLDPEIKEKWYSGKDEGNFHTLYVGEIVEFLAR